MTIGAIIALTATVVIIAVMAYAARCEYDMRKARKSFGPEYDRVRAQYGGAHATNRELARRTQMYDELRLEPVSADDQDFYAASWEHVQGGFLDDPAAALGSAEQLVARLLAARGYPVEDRDLQMALLSVQHGDTVAGYRQAAWAGERLRANPTRVTTEQMRTALMEYQTFFADLLAAPGAVASRRSQETEVAP